MMLRRFGLIQVLVLASTSCNGQSVTPIPLDAVIRQCQQVADDRCNGNLEIVAFLSIEFELVALYSSERAAALRRRKECLGVYLPEPILNQLEAYNRREVMVVGKFGGRSYGGVCGNDYLIAESLEVLEAGEAVSPLEYLPNADLESVSVNGSPETTAAIRAASQAFLVRFSDGQIDDQFWELYSTVIRDELMKAYANPQSRFNFLLENRRLLLGESDDLSSRQIDVLAYPDEESVATACMCKSMSCNVENVSTVTLYQSFADPYFCFNLMLDDEAGRWFVHDYLFTEDPSLGSFLRMR